ncbi:MAG: hypothetical protein K0S55_1514 [Clostridia bacterium]|nr:hypothetical protein [Clostridia bacterium]
MGIHVDKMIGSVLNGRYEILEVIGIGGMSVVYKAADALEDRNVAIKILKDEFVREQRFRRRFLNESRAIAMLSHKNIVDVFDVNFEGEVQYIVMECIEGRTFKEYLTENGPLSVEEALGYCRQILSALQHAHERGVIHRDIKPHNIMLLDDGTIKVTDFGIAHVSNFETVTMTDKAIGSVHYISPEQAKGQTTDERSDIYSTGVMLYEMLVGELPFQADTPVSVALMQVQSNPKNPRDIRPDLPVAIEQIILKAMKKEINQRYQNAEAMLIDINKFENDNTIVFNYPKNEIVGNTDTIVINKIKINENEPKPVIEMGKLKSKDKDKDKNKRWNHLRNKFLAIIGGVFLSFVLILIGLGTMFTMVNNLSDNLVDIPILKGKAISDVKADPFLNKDFILKEVQSFDDTIAAGIIIDQDPSEGRFTTGKEIQVIVSKGKKKVNVPDVKNMEEAQAKVMLKEKELFFERISQQNENVPAGQVIKTEPAENTEVSVGTTVKLYVSVSSAVQKVLVPDVVGFSKSRAITALQKQNLYVEIQEVYDETISTDTVISQSLEKDAEVEAGTLIIIEVSKGSIANAIAQGLYTEPADSITDALTGWEDDDEE